MNGRYLRRVMSLAKWGLAIGAVYTVWVLLLAAKGGSMVVVSEGKDFNVVALAGMYLGGGAVAGCIAGLLFPLVRFWIGSAILGIIAILPFMAGAVLLIAGQTGGWNSGHTVTLVICAICLGGALGPMYRWIFLEEIDAEGGK